MFKKGERQATDYDLVRRVEAFIVTANELARTNRLPDSSNDTLFCKSF